MVKRSNKACEKQIKCYNILKLQNKLHITCGLNHQKSIFWGNTFKN